MVRYLIELDRELFIYLNNFHAPWLDPIMLMITERLIWLPLYIFLIYIIFKDYKQQGWLALIAIILTITLADQITTSIMKPYFARLRPSHEPSLESIVHIVNGEGGGKFGFASSHAANTFGLATFMFLLWRTTRRWVVLLFVWAAVVTYSRVYLGVHYPGDVVVGGLVGVLAAFASFKFFQWLKKAADKRLTQLHDSE